MAISDPTPGVPTPTGVLQGVAAFGWDGSAWQPSSGAGPDVATPTGVLRGVAPFTWDGSAWQPTGRAGPGVATPTGVLDGVAVYSWSGSAWTPPGGQPTPSTPSGALRGVAAFYWDGASWQPVGQAGPSIATPIGVLAGVAMFSWTGSAWAPAQGTGPSLDLSFMTPGTLPPGVTFTRTSTATYFDATGTMQTAAANSPRWDYNPSTHALNGLLIEEARTNQALQSGNIVTSAQWGGNGTTLTGASSVAPDGTTTMTRIAETATTAVHIFNQPGFVIVAATVYTASLFAKAQQNQYLQIDFDDGAGTNGFLATFDLQAGTVSGAATARGTGTQQGATIQPVGNGVYRCTVTGSVGTGTVGRFLMALSQTAAPVFAPSYTGSTANGLLVWGAQIEVGAFPTSYIPTTAASVLRQIDGATLPTSTWFSATASSLAADFMEPQSPNPAAVSRDVCGLSDGTSSNRMILRGLVASANTALFTSVTAGTAGASTSLGVVTASAVSKIAAAWNGVTPVGVLNGGAAVTYSAALPAGINILGIGNQAPPGGAPLNGWVRRVRYWPRALTTAELQAVTT